MAEPSDAALTDDPVAALNVKECIARDHFGGFGVRLIVKLSGDGDTRVLDDVTVMRTATTFLNVSKWNLACEAGTPYTATVRQHIDQIASQPHMTVSLASIGVCCACGRCSEFASMWKSWD